MFCGNAEPSIDELLFDPLVRLRMESAGVVPEAVHKLLRETKRRLRTSDDARDARRDRLASNKPA
jgi:hypothetical protein